MALTLAPLSACLHPGEETLVQQPAERPGLFRVLHLHNRRTPGRLTHPLSVVAPQRINTNTDAAVPASGQAEEVDINR